MDDPTTKRFEKLISSKLIPKENIYFSVRDKELKEVGIKHNINIIVLDNIFLIKHFQTKYFYILIFL